MTEIEKVIPTELDGNSRYAIRVKSINSFGISSDWSETLIVDTEEAGAPTGGRLILTANGLIAYDSNGQTKMVYSGEDSAIRINEVVNPSFEINTTSWTVLDNTTLTRTLADYYIGEPAYLASGQVTCTLNGSAGVGFVTASADRASASPGDVITASAYIKAPVDTVSIKVGIRFYDAGGAILKETTSYSARIIPVDGNWYRVSVVAATAPNLTAEMGFVVYSTSLMTSGQYFYVDGILMENAPTLNDYFDGSTSIGATIWSGTAHNSSSTFDLTASYYVDGGVFTAGTFQTAVDVGEGATPISGVKMSTTGIQGYSGLQATPSFSLDTQGKFRVGGTNNYIYWDGTTLTVVGAVAAGTIDIGGFDSTSFHVDASGQMWMGAGTYNTAPLRISSTGDFYAKSFTLLDSSFQQIASLGSIVTPNVPLSTGFILKTLDSNFSDGGLSWSQGTDDFKYVELSGPKPLASSGGIARISLGASDSTPSNSYLGLFIDESDDSKSGSMNMSFALGDPALFQIYVLDPIGDYTASEIVGDSDGVIEFSATDRFNFNFGIMGIGIDAKNPVTYARLHVDEFEAATPAMVHLTHSSMGSAITNGLTLSVTSGGTAYIIQRENLDLRFRTNDTNVARFTSTGELRFNNSGSVGSPIISFTGDTNTGIYRRGADDIAIAANGTDMIVANATAVYVTLAANGGETNSVRYDGFGGLHVQSSNRDLKDNIKDLPSKIALKLINEFKPKTFTWKPLKTDTEAQAALRPFNPSVGFIAEEVAELGREEGINLAEWKPPSDISQVDDLSKWEVSYWKEPHVIALLVGAVQELTNKLKNLEDKK